MNNLSRQSRQFHEQMMAVALQEAERAALAGEVPVGAVLVRGREIITKAHNLTETLRDPTAHAEILALRDGGKALSDWRLVDTVLYVTLEPCAMCIGAGVLARLQGIVFGARESRFGATGSLFDLSRNCGLPHEIEVVEGVLAEASLELLQAFFAMRRRE